MSVATPRGTPHATRLFGGASLALHDWRCAGHDAPVARDEHTSAFDVVVVRRGAFELDVAGRRQLLVAGQVWFARPGEPYRIRHPVPGGDHCTILRLSAATEQQLLEHAGTDPDELAARSGACVAPLGGREALLHQLAWREAWRAAHGGADALAVEELSLIHI